MKPYQTLKRQSLALAVLFIAVALISIYLFPPTPVLVVTGVLFATALSWRLYRALHRRISEQQLNEFRQIEALTGLYNTLDIQQPLPRTRHISASPDFLHLLACEIFRLRPELIVEVGSGASTLIAAYCLRKIGHGRIVSLDHLEKYAGLTRQAIDAHGLGVWAEVLDAPLRDYDIDGSNYKWYDDAAVLNCDRIDMLVIDGPPHDINVWARYPAIPLLGNRLQPHATVMLDDGKRPDEIAIVDAWRQRYGLQFGFENTEKGTYTYRP